MCMYTRAHKNGGGRKGGKVSVSLYFPSFVTFWKTLQTSADPEFSGRELRLRNQIKTLFFALNFVKHKYMFQ